MQQKKYSYMCFILFKEIPIGLPSLGTIKIRS